MAHDISNLALKRLALSRTSCQLDYLLHHLPDVSSDLLVGRQHLVENLELFIAAMTFLAINIFSNIALLLLLLLFKTCYNPAEFHHPLDTVDKFTNDPLFLFVCLFVFVYDVMLYDFLWSLREKF